MSFSCDLNGGYVLGCSSIGGVEKIWLGEYIDNVQASFDASGVTTGASGATSTSVCLVFAAVFLGGEGIFYISIIIINLYINFDYKFYLIMKS